MEEVDILPYVYSQGGREETFSDTVSFASVSCCIDSTSVVPSEEDGGAEEGGLGASLSTGIFVEGGGGAYPWVSVGGTMYG